MPIPKFLTRTDVLLLHADQIESFGGTPGLRDVGLLDSALAQPEATFAGELLHPTMSAQAAAYLYHLAMNHSFIDGNKRTAFAVMDTFLRVNAYVLTLTAILRTVFVKVLETLMMPLTLTLTLNPSPKRGEGLQSGAPSPFLGEGAGG